MKLSLFATAALGSGVVLSAFVACADGEPPADATLATPDDAGSTPAPIVPDATRDAISDAAPSSVLCSPDGWCETDLPDPEFFVYDLFPFANGKAFAAGNVRYFNGKLLELDGGKWRVVRTIVGGDSNRPLTAVPPVLWASSENDLWIGSVENTQTGALIHGVRSGTTWTWSKALPTQPDYTYVVSLWGSGPNDVYAVASSLSGVGQVFHVAPGATAATVELSIPGVRLYQVVGNSPNDVWVVGESSGCMYIAHKQSATGGFVLLSGGTLTFEAPGIRKCTSADETGPPLAGVVGSAELPFRYSIPAVAARPNEMVTIIDGVPHRFRHAGGGPLEVTRGAHLSAAMTSTREITSAWSSGGDSLWVAGLGRVAKSDAPFADGGTFGISSVALNGSALTGQFTVIRGSGDHTWVAGEGYALHKQPKKGP